MNSKYEPTFEPNVSLRYVDCLTSPFKNSIDIFVIETVPAAILLRINLILIYLYRNPTGN
jgi:hypothetical protein